MNARHQNETTQTLLSASPMFMLHAESLESLVEEGKRTLPATFFSSFPQTAQRDENFCFSSYISSITSNAINSLINPPSNNLVFTNIKSETSTPTPHQARQQPAPQQQMRYMSAIDSLNYSLQQQSIQPQPQQIQQQPQGAYLTSSTRLVPQSTPDMLAYASQLPHYIPSNQPPSQQQQTHQPAHLLPHHNLQIQIQPHHQRQLQQQHQVLQNRESPISSPTGSACSSTCTSPVAPYPTSGMFSSNSEEEPLIFIKKYLENYQQSQNVGSSSQPSSHEVMQTIHQLAEATRKAEQRPKKSAKGQKENASIKWKRALQEHQQSIQKQIPPSAAQGSRATASSSAAPAATTGIRKKKRSKKWTDMTPLHMKMPQ